DLRSLHSFPTRRSSDLRNFSPLKWGSTAPSCIRNMFNTNRLRIVSMTQSVHAETHGFQTEVKQLLSLMAHSLYSNKEVFLRELISNASDAADKLRFKALSDASLFENDGQLRVRLVVDKENRTLTISDNGIGMTRDQVIEHLGTIAKSGTA